MLESTGEATVVVLAELDEATGVSLARMADAYLLRAAVEQANGALSLVTCEGGSALQLTFPRARPASSPSGEPVAATLH
jgi:hypothetical protein